VEGGNELRHRGHGDPARCGDADRRADADRREDLDNR